MNWLLNLVGSGLVSALGDAILKPVLAHLDTKATAQRDVTLAQTGADKERDVALVQAEIQANAVAMQFAARFPVIVYLTWAPFALHLWAVTLVTVFSAPIVIPAFPPTFEHWEGVVLLAPFVTHAIQMFGRGVASRFSR